MSYFNNLPYKPGLCCISLEMQKRGLKFKTIRKSTFDKKVSSVGLNVVVDQLDEIYRHNSIVLLETINYCEKMGFNYRVSSGIFPLHDLSIRDPNTNLISVVYDHILSKYGLPLSLNPIPFYRIYFPNPFNNEVRFSTHPDQYVVLASDKPNVVLNSAGVIANDDYFLTVLKGEDYNQDKHPINVHMGTFKGNIEDIKNRFIHSYEGYFLNDLNGQLVLENEDKGYWNVENLYSFAYKKLKIPITFDYLHHKCNPGSLTEQEAFEMCYSTWKNKPLFHYSESIPGDKNPRKHADFPTSRPNTYGYDVDIDYEFKQKDFVIMRA